MSSLPARIRFARRIAAGDASLHLYAILDVESCQRRGLDTLQVAQAWRDAGVRLLQLRDKQGSDDEVLRSAERIATVFRTEDSFLLLNDRAHLVVRAGWDGVHIGQGDGDVSAVRSQVGGDSIVGLSTHTPQQAESAGREDVDYVACGPVFATSTKLDAEPVIGLCGLQAVRAITAKPLVAIGGIGLGQAGDVRRSGADSIALISALLPQADGPPFHAVQYLGQRVQDFLAALQ
ncbi:MAG: thiamine phosphate synthase [Janthinobacterium lividum]